MANLVAICGSLMADSIEASLLLAGVGAAAVAAAADGGLLEEDSRAELLVVALGVGVGLAVVLGPDTVDADEVVVDFALDLSSATLGLVSVISDLTVDAAAGFSLAGAGFGAGGGRVIIRTMNFFSSILYSDNLFSSASILPE